MVFLWAEGPLSTAHTGLFQTDTTPEELFRCFARLQAQQDSTEIQCPEASLKHSICFTFLHSLLPSPHSNFEGCCSYFLASSKTRSCNYLENLQIICHHGCIAQMRVNQA